MLYVFRKTFEGLEPVEVTFDSDKLQPHVIEHAFGLGLKNMCVDSMAGKMDDPVEARQALVEKIQRIESGDVKGTNRGPRLSEEERVFNEVLDGFMRLNLKPGAKMPTKKEELVKLRESFLQVDGVKDHVEAEVAARRKREAALIGKINWTPPTA